MKIEVILLSILSITYAQQRLFRDDDQDEYVYRQGNDILWCCLSKEEVAKCRSFADAVEEDHLADEITFGSYYRKVKCRQFQNKDECMRLIDDQTKPENPNVIVLDAGEVFFGGWDLFF